MSTSDSGGNNKPAPPAGAPSSYTRFIPREELGSVKAWLPQTFEVPQPAAKEEGGVRKPTLAERAAAEVRPSMKSQTVRHAAQAAQADAAAAASLHNKAARGPQAAAPARPATPVRRPVVGGVPGQAEAQEQAAAAAAAAAAAEAAKPPIDVDALVAEARNAGYQDGYRNGLAALESYKQTQAAQMAAYMSDQVGALAADFHHRLESLEQQLAGRIAGVALELARQVVRSELQLRADVVVDVAEEALGALLASARQIVLRLHPEDHALAQSQLTEMLAARGARLVPDAAITRGGCMVESDIAVVDATVESRWERAAAAMGHHAPWNGGREAHEPTERRLPESEDPQSDAWPETESEASSAMLDLPLEGEP